MAGAGHFLHNILQLQFGETGFVTGYRFCPRNCLRGVNFTLGTGHPICLIENDGIGGSLWGDYAKFTFNSIAAAAGDEERRIFLAASFTMGIRLTLRRELREKNIFRSPSPFRAA